MDSSNPFDTMPNLLELFGSLDLSSDTFQPPDGHVFSLNPFADVEFRWEKDRLLDVFDQRDEECCWAIVFADVTAIKFAIEWGLKPEKLSAQQLIDYLPDYSWSRSAKLGIYGEAGSILHDAFTLVTEMGGICDEKSYPKSLMRAVPSCDPPIESFALSVDGIGLSPEFPQGWANIQELLRKHPVPGIIQLYESFVQFKGKGVYMPDPDEYKIAEEQRKNKTAEYHAVIVVGFGIKNGIPCYLIKNSWGPWADGGYAWVECSLVTLGPYPQFIRPHFGRWTSP